MKDTTGSTFEIFRSMCIFMLLCVIFTVGSAYRTDAAETVLDGPGYYNESSYTWQNDGTGWWYGMPSSSGSFYYADKWLDDDGNWYYFDNDGYMKTGWLDWNDGWYYFDPETGKMAVDTALTIDGVTYVFDNEGHYTVDWPYKLPVQIPPDEEKNETFLALDAICDSVLASIINDGMSEREKATAIYNWIQNNFRYTGHSATRDWVTEAYNGLRRHYGDCYTYFSVAQALLTRAGFPSIEVVRYTDNDHYWNLTMVDGNWYHFDTTPRTWGRSFCLKTDAEMLSMSAAHNGCFAFDTSLYPPTP